MNDHRLDPAEPLRERADRAEVALAQALNTSARRLREAPLCPAKS